MVLTKPPMPSTIAVAGVKRIVYKEIVEGDFRKFKAESNDADTGGGARDLRFRPHDEFAKVFRELFPRSQQKTRKRDGKNRSGRSGLWR